MSQVSYEAAMAAAKQSGNGNSKSYPVGFFSLKDDGDEAIVRIMHDSLESFDIVAAHKVEVNGKDRNVNCLRENANEPLSKCPFCENGFNISNRLYIHLIQYTNVNGQIVPEAKVWERGLTTFGPRIKSLLDTYGPLSECLFKVHRSGVAGDKKADYSFMYIPPQALPAEQYPKRADLLEGYTAVGNVVIDRNFEDMQEYVKTGNFPYHNQNAAVPDGVPYDSGQGQAMMQQMQNSFTQATAVPQQFASAPQAQAPQNTGNVNPATGEKFINPAPAPWDDPTPAVAKPNRFY